MMLIVVPEFGLGAGRWEFRVQDAFLPEKEKRTTWETEDGSVVEFLPFLVVLKAEDKDAPDFWLPYWHIVNGDSPEAKEEKKYGQYAPVMDGHLFTDLVEQARRKGYLP